MAKKDLLKVFREYFFIVLSAVCSALSFLLFIEANDFAPAGITGVATMIQYLTGFSVGYMFLIINIPLCIFAFFLIDRKFAFRSLCYSVIYSVSIIVLQKVDIAPFVYDAMGSDTIIPALLSGLIGGFVYGLCIRNRGSTGGTDIISKYISTVKPELNFFYVSFFINALVAIASFFVYAKPDGAGGLVYDYKPVCLCIIYSFVSSFVANYILSGTKKACQFTVVTDHPDEITADVFREIRHGMTRIPAVGSYNMEEKTVLICVVNRHQQADFINILKRYEGTFSYCETVDETFGNFFQIRK